MHQLTRCKCNYLGAIALALFALAMPVLSADNQHDHNTHQEIAGPLLPDKYYDFNKPQAAPNTDPLTQSSASASCPGATAQKSQSVRGSPVVLQTGEFVWVSVDIALAGRPGLSLARSYGAFDARDGLFGKGWNSHCEKALVKVLDYESSAEPTMAYLYRLANGQRFRFAEISEGQYQTPDGLLGLTLNVNSNNTVTLRSISSAQETYNAIGQLVSESGRNGNTVNYTYRDGTLIQIADTYGRSLTLSTDSTGHVSRVTDHTGRRWSYTYNLDGSLASVSDPIGGSMNYDYVNITRAANAVVFPAISRVTDESGVVIVSVTYDENGRVASYTEGENQYTYTRSRGLVYKTDTLGSDWSYTLDDIGRKTKIVYPTGYSEQFEYDNDSNITQYTNGVGTEFTATYDTLGRMLSQTTPDGTTQFAYENDTNWMTSVTSPSGRITSIAYDSRGNPTTVTDPGGFETSFSWSREGDLLKTTDALGGEVVQTVNNIGLPLTITDQLGRVTTFAYNNLGNLTGATNALGNASAFTYDQLDRMTGSTDALGHVTSYNVDPAGRLLSLTDANGGITQFEYDVLGRQVSETRPDSSVIRYTFRADNMVETQTDPREIVTTYRYSDDKQLTRATAGAREIATLTYDRISRLAGARYGTTLAYEYDAMSRTTVEQMLNRRTLYQYTSEGELASIEAAGETWQYEYDNRGLLIGFTTPEGRHQYSHDALGRRVSHTLPNGSVNTFEYDAASQLTEQNYAQTSGDVLTYSYDALGQVTDIVSTLNTDWSYQYDSINRLTGALHDQMYTYQYDALGNRLDNGGVYDAFNKLLENNDFTYDYDAAGNLVAKVSKLTSEQHRYTYNGFGRLSGVDIAPVAGAPASYSATYAYDINGRRIEKRAGNSLTFYQWSGTDLIGEYASNTLVKTYRYAGGYAAAEFSDTNGTYHVQTNHLDTPLSLTDGGNAVVWSQALSPYGSSVGASTGVIDFNQRFPGQYFDSDSGLHYNYFRNYDPELGRYIESDPIGISGGLNSYSYANNQPSGTIDPLGLKGGSSNSGKGIFTQLLMNNPISSVLGHAGNGVYIHATRNVYNRTVPYSHVSDPSNGWVLLSTAKSRLHNPIFDQTRNEKWVHKSGYEAVFNSQTHERVTGILGPSFNFGSEPVSASHVLLDIAPFVPFGIPAYLVESVGSLFGTNSSMSCE